MNQQDRRKMVYEELKQAIEERDIAIAKTIDKHNISEKLNNAYKNQDQFEMFNLVSVIVDENADLIARVSWLEMTKDFAYVEDMNLGNAKVYDVITE